MNSYKFQVGDLLKLRSGFGYLASPGNPSKEYRDSLRVAFRFWDGKDNVYVVTSDDGFGLTLLEEYAELQEAAQETEEAPKDGRDKHLYRIKNRIGEFYVVAHSFDEAADELKERLRKADYGFYQDRNAPSIDHLAVQAFWHDKQLFSGDEANLIVVE